MEVRKQLVGCASCDCRRSECCLRGGERVAPTNSFVTFTRRHLTIRGTEPPPQRDENFAPLGKARTGSRAMPLQNRVTRSASSSRADRGSSTATAAASTIATDGSGACRQAVDRLPARVQRRRRTALLRRPLHRALLPRRRDAAGHRPCAECRRVDYFCASSPVLGPTQWTALGAELKRRPAIPRAVRRVRIHVRARAASRGRARRTAAMDIGGWNRSETAGRRC